jgi:hypothetical protein
LLNARLLATAAVAGIGGATAIDLYLIVTETFVIRNATPLLVMQWDASNLLGRAAYYGGWATAALGTLMHFAVSILWATIFVVAATRIRPLALHPVLSGASLGLIAMAVMRAVIHLGHAVVRPFPNVWVLSNILIAHVVFFGIPVALVATRRLRNLSA